MSAKSAHIRVLMVDDHALFYKDTIENAWTGTLYGIVVVASGLANVAYDAPRSIRKL